MRYCGLFLPLFLLFAFGTDHGDAKPPHTAQLNEAQNMRKGSELSSAPSRSKRYKAQVIMVSPTCALTLKQLNYVLHKVDPHRTGRKVHIIPQLYQEPHDLQKEICLDVINTTLEDKIMLDIHKAGEDLD